MNVLDLFSCVGGHALGLHATGGFRTVQFVERRADRRAILASRFPGVPIHDDVRTFRAEPGSAGLLIGGPPCQRTSVAAAMSGNRTGESLLPEMLRVSAELQGQWIVVEQPPGNSEWETEVGEGLARLGHHSAKLEFSADDLGAPHIRRRVFILAHRDLSRLALAWSAGSSEVERIKGLAAAGSHWAEGVPGALRVVDRPPYRMDRTARIEAIGDSNPPIMATVIGRAILQAEREMKGT